ncbi:hypothetical protein F5887DRAFT_189977 [Amanita rubescens]|nr:hypothetical protein F5887DRAFT_189977 [Amanita rubescens]
MSQTPENTTKRPVGRPRGSKNKPDAGMRGNPVGRPRKSQSAPTARARTAQAGLRTEPLTALPETSPANPVVIYVPIVASCCCCCRASESAPAVSSANTQRDTDSCVELGSGKTEPTAPVKLAHPKVQASGEKGSFSIISDGHGAPTVVRSECESGLRSIDNCSLGSLTMTSQQAGESVLYYAHKLQSSQTPMPTTIFKYVDPSRLVSADRSQGKAGSSRKRVHSETDQEADPSAKRRRAPRTCLKCRRMDCPGRWKADKCTDSCTASTP